MDFFFFQAEDGIRDYKVTGVQTCALPILLKIKNGPTIYHSGDTAYFKDMEVIGERYAPDVALLNIGGHFGMEPEMAARAAASVRGRRSEEHTSELQSPCNLVCRLLLEKKKKN